MAPGSHWSDANFLHDLVMVFYEVGTEANAVTAEMRKDIAARMNDRNHEVTWEGIRMPRQVMKWDQRVHEDILLAVFNHVSFTNEQMAKIMDELRVREYAFSESALRITPHPLHHSSCLAPPNTHKWDEKSHYGLLLAMIEVAKPSKDVLIHVAEHMQSQGFSTTYNGINQHIQKLRRTQDSPEKSANCSVPSTPSKPTPKRKARAPKAAHAKSASGVDDLDDEIPIKSENYDFDKDGEPEPKRSKKEVK